MSNVSEYSLMNHGGYKAAYDKLQELNKERDSVESEINKLLNTCESEEAKNVKDKKILAIIAGQDPDSVQEANYSVSLEKSYERKRLINAAIEKQRKNIAEQRMIASKEIMKQAGPKYRELIRKQAIQYIRLAEIVVEERELRLELRDNDLSFHEVRPMAINFGDNPLEASSRFAMYMIECVEYGFLKESDIPKMFKNAWKKRSGFVFKTGLAAIVG